MNHTAYMDRWLDKQKASFDEKEHMITEYREPDRKHGYHSDIAGKIHGIKSASCFALCALLSERSDLYEKAVAALHRVCDLQDTQKESKTFGLWAYYAEQSLSEMTAPDYNWANFVGCDLIAVCRLCGDRLPLDLLVRVRAAIGNAAICTVRRNVAADYTNISLAASLTLVSAGELLRDDAIFQIGKERLSMLTQYTKVTTGLSEYNSAAYTVVALDMTTRMLQFFEDAQCREMARYLNHCTWKMLAEHYNTAIAQLSPPQVRAYTDFDTGKVASVIYMGTNGRYGELREETVDPDMLAYVSLSCPEELLPLFAENERFLAHTYYHKNDIRQQGEDVTIIRELDSPDLTAYTYLNPRFSTGAFSICDTWNQRRNVMVIWDREHPKMFRLRGLHDGYDFCSGFVRAQQKDGNILGHLGIVNDRGSNHYILDKDKSGIYSLSELCFAFELGGACENLTIRREGDRFLIDDGDMHIVLHIAKWVYDGADATIECTADGKRVVLRGYCGERIRLDTTKLGDTYAVFTVQSFYGDAPRMEDVSMLTQWENGYIESNWTGLTVKSHRDVVPYRRAIGLDE